MVLLYYTNSETPGLQQPFPYKSIGGYVSGTPVSNDTLDNIFTSINRSVQKPKQEYILLALKNNHSQSVGNISLQWFISDEAISQFYLGVTTPSEIDDCNEDYERIQNANSRPVSAEFVEITDGEVINLEDVVIESGKTIGLWISRKISQLPTDDFDCETLALQHQQQIVPEQADYIDQLILNINYDIINNNSDSDS